MTNSIVMISLPLAELERIVEDASARGAARALREHAADAWLDARAAAEYCYGQPGKEEA